RPSMTVFFQEIRPPAPVPEASADADAEAERIEKTPRMTAQLRTLMVTRPGGFGRLGAPLDGRRTTRRYLEAGGMPVAAPGAPAPARIAGAPGGGGDLAQSRGGAEKRGAEQGRGADGPEDLGWPREA